MGNGSGSVPINAENLKTAGWSGATGISSILLYIALTGGSPDNLDRLENKIEEIDKKADALQQLTHYIPAIQLTLGDGEEAIAEVNGRLRKIENQLSQLKYANEGYYEWTRKLGTRWEDQQERLNSIQVEIETLKNLVDAHSDSWHNSIKTPR